MFTTTKGRALLTTTTGALPRPGWYTENLRGIPLSHGFSRLAYREQHFDCLACHVAAQHRAGIDIFVDGDTATTGTSIPDIVLDLFSPTDVALANKDTGTNPEFFALERALSF